MPKDVTYELNAEVILLSISATNFPKCFFLLLFQVLCIVMVSNGPTVESLQ